jgi:hypothetical protein
MKKVLLGIWMAVAATGGALEWELPVITLKGEVAEGAAESDAEAGVLETSSERATVTLTIRESANPLDLAWIFRWSAKEWVAQAGDYSYLEAVQEARLEATDRLRLTAGAGVKRMREDWTALQAKLGADLEVVRGISLALGLDGRWEVHDDATESRQRWTGSAALVTHLGGWQLEARWRGEFRLPLGGATGVEASALHTGNVSLRWDPNP